jgi:hypothetical protein
VAGRLRGRNRRGIGRKRKGREQPLGISAPAAKLDFTNEVIGALRSQSGGAHR